MLTTTEAANAIANIEALAGQIKAAKADKRITKAERQEITKAAIKALAQLALDVLD